MEDLHIEIKDVEFYPPYKWEGGYNKPRRTWDSANQCWKDDPTEKNTQAQPTGAKGTEKASATTHPKVVSLLDKRNLKAKLIGFSGKFITFSVVKLMKEGSLDYVLCDIEDEINPPELRIFVKGDSMLGKLLLGSTALFKAKVGGHTMSGNSDKGYLRVDHRTVSEVDIESDPQLFADSFKNTTFYGYMGKRLTLEEFYIATELGCACCGDFVSPKDCADVSWISDRDFFCKTCKNTELASQYSSYVHQD